MLGLVDSAGRREEKPGQLGVVFWHDPETDSTISVEDPASDEQSRALVSLGERLCPCDATDGSRRRRYWVAFGSELIQEPFDPVELIRLVVPFVVVSNRLVDGYDDGQGWQPQLAWRNSRRSLYSTRRSASHAVSSSLSASSASVRLAGEGCDGTVQCYRGAPTKGTLDEPISLPRSIHVEVSRAPVSGNGFRPDWTTGQPSLPRLQQRFPGAKSPLTTIWLTISATERGFPLPGHAEGRPHGRLELGVAEADPGGQDHVGVGAHRHPQWGARVLDGLADGDGDQFGARPPRRPVTLVSAPSHCSHSSR